MKKLSKQKRDQLNFNVSSLSPILLTTDAWNWKIYTELTKVLDQIEKVESEIKNFQKFERPHAIEKFTKWSKENGAQFDSVRIAEFKGYEMGLEATKDLKKDDVFIKVPKKILFSLENGDPELTAIFDKFPDRGNFQLAMILIVEKLKANSFYKPYIDILPRKYSVPLFFTIGEMEMIKNTQAFLPAMNLLKTTVLQYYHVYRYLHYVMKDSEMNPTLEMLREKFTFDLFRWATATVMTRQNMIPYFPPGEIDSDVKLVPALIPFWDMANHISNGYIATQFNDEVHAVESSAIQDFKKGEQIFIYYGDRNNIEMLINNGFFCDDGEFCLWFHVPGGDTDYRKPLYQRLGFTGNSIGLPICQKPNYLTPKFFAIHRVFVMTKEHVNDWMTNKSDEELEKLMAIDYKLDDKLEKQLWQSILIRLRVTKKIDDAEIVEELKNLEITKKKQVGAGRIATMLIDFRCKESEIMNKALAYVEELIKKNV